MSGKPWVMRGLLVVFACALAFVTACSPDTNRLIVSLAEGKKGATLRPSETIAFTMTVSPTLTVTPTPTPSDTATPVPTATATPTPIPTYVKLRAEVIIQQAVCHYGPGQPYLYKYGVYQGNRLEVIRRVIGHNYVEIQAIGGNNPCWVRLDYLKLNGDWMNLEPVAADEVALPLSPYYGPPAWVKAERNGDEVRVTYSGIQISPGKDSLQTPYIVEAWVCQGGQQVFIPAGSWTFAVTIRDEAGCAEPSRARLLAAEKHGYTRPVEIDWPQPEQTGAPAIE